MNRLGSLVVHRPWLVIILTVFITALLGSVIAIRGVRFDGSIETLTRKDSDFDFFNQIRSLFGDDRVIVVALTTSDVFKKEFIDRLSAMTARLGAVKGVEAAESLVNAKNIRRSQDGVEVDSLLPRHASDADLQQIRDSILKDHLFVKNFISADGRTAAINVFLRPMDGTEAHAVADEIARVSQATAGPDQLVVAGVPLVESRAIQSMTHDMMVCSPVAGLLCIAIFILSFRSLWVAIIPVAALGIGLVWVIGLMCLADRPVTIATLPLPTTLIAIGASYMFHVLNQCRLSMNEYVAYVAKKPRSESADSPLDAVARSALVTAQARRSCWLDGLQFIIPAVLVSGLATMAGFAALTSSSIPTARDMGAFNAVGVAVMLALTLLFVPAALSVIPAHAFQPRSSKHTEYAKPVGRLLRHVAALVMFRRPLVWLAFVGAFVLMTAGAFRMRVETDYLGIFPRTSPTVRDARLLHERIAGASTVEVVVSGGPDALYSPAFLQAVANLEQFALTQPGVDAALSVSDIVKRINSVVDPASGEVIPAEAGRIKSLFRDFLSNEPDIKRLVASADTGQGSRAVIVLRTSLSASSSLHVLTSALAGWASANLPPGVKARATGSVVLLNDASDAVASSQMSSLALALISIYVMMVLLFRSFACGLLALIPNLLPTIGFFGFLGWFSIPLDLTTSLVATSALGLAVDNAVHLIRRYRQCSAMGRNKGWVMWLTLVRTGKPMVLANLTLIAGFLIFMASSFVPVRLAGLLWAVTIAACLAADLVFLPVLMTAKWFEKSASGSAPEGAGGLPRGADSAVKTSF